MTQTETRCYGSIYALIDPRDDTVRYVGMSTDPRRREREHLTTARDPRNESYTYRWYRTVLRDELTPRLEVLETGSWTYVEMCLRERHWIKEFKRAGVPITNTSDGGRGYRWHDWAAARGADAVELFRRRVSDARRQLFDDPVRGARARAQISRGLRELFSDPLRGPAARERISNSQRASFRDSITGPARRQRTADAVRASFQDPARRRDQSDRVRQYFDDPDLGESRRRHVARSLHEFFNDPEHGAERRRQKIAKTTAANRGRDICPDCGNEFNPVWMTRHKTSGKCTDASLAQTR